MAGGGGGDKTEKATPKRRQEARKKGQVTRSADLNGAVVLLAALFALSATAPHLVEVLQTSMRTAFALITTPEIVDHKGLGALINVVQVGGRPHVAALKPDPKRLNPLQGAKNIFGPNALFEGAKNLVKVTTVGAVTAMAVLPRLDELATLVGLPPSELMPTLAHTVIGIAQRAAMAYLVIGVIDYAYQKRRHEKSLKMDKQEVKEEHKSNELPPEIRGAMRRRQMQAARQRMMADVPQADVVVTNPTH